MVTPRGIAFQRATIGVERAACAGREAKRITGVRFDQNKIEKTDVENVRNFFGDPFEVKGELFSSSKVTVLLCPL